MIYKPEELPISVGDMSEVSGTMAILGIWDHYIGDY